MPKIMKRRQISSIEYYDYYASDYDQTVKNVNAKGHLVIAELISPDKVFAGQKMLDIGCGTGLVSQLFANEALEIHGIDGSEKMLLQFLLKGIAFDLKVVDLIDNPFPYHHEFFDHVVSSRFFGLIENLDSVFKEASRVLKRHGLFCFTFERSPNGSTTKIMRNNMEILLHGSEDVGKELSTNGFVIRDSRQVFDRFDFPSNEEIFFTAILAQKI